MTGLQQPPTKRTFNVHTPWGLAQTIDTIANGIQSVTTASHGGILLDPERTAAIPPYMASATFTGNRSAYEEDSDWCMPVLVFEADFRAFYVKKGRTNLDAIFHSAKAILQNSHPRAFEQFYGVTLKPGESHKRDEQQFYIDNKDNWIVATAWGDWHKDVPKVMVGVCARQGGCESEPRDRYFLVPANEYRNSPSRFGFVIDPARHQQIPPFV
jgi:hypothetical protein